MHSLKGLAGTLGANALFKTVQELEADLGEQGVRAARPLLAALDREMAVVFEAARLLEEDGGRV